MDYPICFSQHFVNKQNVRSFQNIFKRELLKKSDVAPFVQQVFEDETMVSGVSCIFLNILNNIRINLRDSSKNDFKNYFTRNVDCKKTILSPVEKFKVFESCWKALLQIIPSSFFGGNHNVKIFRKLVQRVLCSMNHEHLIMNKITKNWDFTTYPWKTLSEDKSLKVLFKILEWILKNILSAIICLNFYVTTCKLDNDEFKLTFFWKNQWQSFYDKKISDLVLSKTLKKFEPYSLGKNMKRLHSLGQRLRIKKLKKEIPKLHFILKKNNGFRPIVRYKNELQSLSGKYKMREKSNFIRILCVKSHKRIEVQFTELYAEWSRLKKPKLYFIKADLSNAFGCINREKLMKILNERYLNLLKTETSLSVKQKYTKIFKDTVSDIRTPILVRAGSTVYEWKEGLVQGYKYSPALSDLYYSYMDKIYFSEMCKNSKPKLRLFTRVVDDYLYITDSLEDANLFLNALSNYRNVNYEKTTVNFPHPEIKCSDEITFLGYTYDTMTLQVSRAKNIYYGLMCYKIAFTNAISNLENFLQNRIGQSGITISSHIFNYYYNTEEIVWKHIFTTFCISANKFCCILAICEPMDMQNFLPLYKKKVTVKLSNAMIDVLMRNKPDDFKFMYCINHFRYLSYKALSMCAKKTPKCNGIVPQINKELAKSYCIFGKWKEHASRINTNGVMEVEALRKVCTRSDLRVIFKKFESLPTGFQCYNHRSLFEY